MIDSIEPWRLWMLFGPLIVACAAGLSALLVTWLLPWLTRNALAQPNARSSHRIPTPQGGGIAVIAATIIVSALAALSVSALWPGAPIFWVLLAMALFIAIIGALDDMRTIEVVPRLILQTITVTIIVSFLPADTRVFSALPLQVERPLLILGGIWFVNLVNFMDGMDWMTVAEVVPVAGGLAVLGLMHALPPYAVLLALALCGAMLGFAPFNRPVARLFLGDVGSLPIGALLGGLLVLLAGAGHLAAAVLLPLYYLSDATITLLIRLARRERIWVAHRSHFYQRAIDRGVPVYYVAGAVFGVNIALAALAATTIVVPARSTSTLALGAGAILIGWLLGWLARGRRP